MTCARRIYSPFVLCCFVQAFCQESQCLDKACGKGKDSTSIESSQCGSKEACSSPDQTTLLQVQNRVRTYHAVAETGQEHVSGSSMSSSATTFRCVGSDRNRSCLFRNLYYEDGQFRMYVTERPNDKDVLLYRADKYGYASMPDIKQFESEKAIADYVASKDVIEEKGLSVQFDPLFHQNIGHALFDGLYPAFLATVKLGVQDRPWRPVVAVDAGCIDDPSSGELQVDSLVETYLPDAQYDRTLRPLRAKVVSLPKAQLVEEENLCQWKSGLDHKGMDLGATGGLSQQSCMKECAKSFSCKAAVLFGGMCYLKGEGGYEFSSPGRELCILQESSKAKPHIVVMPEKGQGVALKEVSVPQEWMVGKVRQRCMSEGIYETFGGVGEIRRLFELERDARNHAKLLVRFDDIVMGVGGAGNLIADKTGAIGGSVAPKSAMSQFRDRMVRSYGLDVESGVKPLPADRDLNVIVVANKRFSNEDRVALDGVIQKLNQKGRVKAKFIDWASVGRPGKFQEHLKMTQETDVYISSIGTALQYVPFMKDGKVYIALGSVWQRSGRNFPTFMEQQLAGGGTPYLRTLYADPGAVLRKDPNSVSLYEDGYYVGVDGNLVQGLVQKAEKLVREGFHIPIPAEDNLSSEAKVLVELCKRDPIACTEMNEYRNYRAFECEAILWNEAVVYEVGPWGEAGNCGNSHRKLLRKIRKEYGLPAYGAPEN